MTCSVKFTTGGSNSAAAANRDFLWVSIIMLMGVPASFVLLMARRELHAIHRIMRGERPSIIRQTSVTWSEHSAGSAGSDNDPGYEDAREVESNADENAVVEVMMRRGSKSSFQAPVDVLDSNAMSASDPSAMASDPEANGASEVNDPRGEVLGPADAPDRSPEC